MTHRVPRKAINRGWAKNTTKTLDFTVAFCPRDTTRMRRRLPSGHCYSTSTDTVVGLAKVVKKEEGGRLKEKGWKKTRHGWEKLQVIVGYERVRERVWGVGAKRKKPTTTNRMITSKLFRASADFSPEALAISAPRSIYLPLTRQRRVHARFRSTGASSAAKESAASSSTSGILIRRRYNTGFSDPDASI
ncbi:hypothetical protein KM043_011535 [Ampulex compressa]|nr:hypothetical protein KM043_011535 [Ampulex compressa]